MLLFQKLINTTIKFLMPTEGSKINNLNLLKKMSLRAMHSAKDIIKAIETYIDTPDTKYAIMIDGEWGCGKTYLWKTIIHPKIGRSESIYLSMFGLKDIIDIENEIFKALSIVGNDKDGILKELLNSNSYISEGVKLGGLGLAVQFGLQKWKENRIKKSKSLFICFDDLERWVGDIQICLSYINKLVEHEGVKCLIIGNTKEIRNGNEHFFNDTKEKTIGFKYELVYPSEVVLKVAIGLINFSNNECKHYINNLFNKNASRIYDLLDSVNCSNIRTVSRAINYLATIYSENKDRFEVAPAHAISYFISLLSTLILVEHHRNSDEDRKNIFNTYTKNLSQLYKKVGIEYFSTDGKRIQLSDEQRNVEDLIQKIFYHTSEIKHKGKHSIIKCGYYRDEDFEEEFTEWKKTEDYEYYMDTFKYYCLDDEEADRIFKNTFNAVFIEKKSHAHRFYCY